VQILSVVALIFALVVAIFAVQNAGMVEINFLIWQFPQTSLVLVILGSAAFGALFVFLLGLVKQLRMLREIRNLRNQNSKLEEKVAKLEQVHVESAENQGQEVQVEEMTGEQVETKNGECLENEAEGKEKE